MVVLRVLPCPDDERLTVSHALDGLKHRLRIFTGTVVAHMTDPARGIEVCRHIHIGILGTDAGSNALGLLTVLTAIASCKGLYPVGSSVT